MNVLFLQEIKSLFECYLSFIFTTLLMALTYGILCILGSLRLA